MKNNKTRFFLHSYRTERVWGPIYVIKGIKATTYGKLPAILIQTQYNKRYRPFNRSQGESWIFFLADINQKHSHRTFPNFSKLWILEDPNQVILEVKIYIWKDRWYAGTKMPSICCHCSSDVNRTFLKRLINFQ